MERCRRLLPAHYETPRVARVRSPALAATKSCLVLATVLLYMLCVICLYQKKYLAFESPDGTATVTLKQPDAGILAEHQSSLPYCDRAAHTLPDQIPNAGPGFAGRAALTRPCQYRDEYFAWYPQIEHNAMFATTRVTSQPQHLPDTCTASDAGRAHKACLEWQLDAKDVFFVSQVEDFTVMIDHNFNAPLAQLSQPSTDPSVLDGWICQACADDGDDVLGVSTCNDACEKDSDRVVVPCEDYTSRGLPCPDVVNVGTPRTRAGCQSTKCRDVVPLRTLLRAAGITSLDSEGEYHDGTLGRQSWRFSGLILHVDIFYTNHGVTNMAGLFSSSAYNPKEYEYFYVVKKVKDTSFAGTQMIDTDVMHGRNRTLLDRHGIRLVFTVTGSIGHKDWQGLVVNLAAATSVLAGLTMLLESVVLSERCCCRRRWCGDAAQQFEEAKYEAETRGSVRLATLPESSNDDLTQRLRIN